jgi:hypothetical protein
LGRDFTLEKIKELLSELQNGGFKFIPYEDYSKSSDNKMIILRHDVDKLPGRSLKFAEIQNKMGIRGTYYFRSVKESFDISIIKKIMSLGHEIGYHYEDLALSKGNYEKAIELFKDHLEKIRKYYPVKTICMHGSPLSKYDNKKLWKKYSYREYGIIAEPYFDLDFDKIFYITDTGRRWDGGNVSIRDKVITKYKLNYKTTNDIIRAVGENSFPEKVMMTFHPQRWTDGILSWSGELLGQNTKNVLKKIIVKRTK